jgi:hypothetical protein
MGLLVTTSVLARGAPSRWRPSMGTRGGHHMPGLFLTASKPSIKVRSSAV